MFSEIEMNKEKKKKKHQPGLYFMRTYFIVSCSCSSYAGMRKMTSSLQLSKIGVMDSKSVMVKYKLCPTPAEQPEPSAGNNGSDEQCGL